VWVVEDDEKFCQAAFTVRRECIAYLLNVKPADRKLLSVQKLKDGGGEVSDLWTADDFIEACTPKS
jgi:hypothetical protein